MPAQLAPLSKPALDSLLRSPSLVRETTVFSGGETYIKIKTFKRLTMSLPAVLEPDSKTTSLKAV